MTASTCGTCGGGLDAEQLRLILADVNAAHRALVEELSRRLQESEQARRDLKGEVDRLNETLDGVRIGRAVDADPEVVAAREQAKRAREKELADLKEKVCELEKQVAALTAEKTSFTSEKSTLVTENLKLQKEVSLLKIYVERLEKAIREAAWCRKPEMPKRPTEAAPGAAA